MPTKLETATKKSQGDQSMLKQKQSVPLYKQISEDIYSQIKSGQLKIGQQIDSNKQLAEGYSVSLITIKKAISELINEGILTSQVGKGTFVAKSRKSIRISKQKAVGLVLSDLNDPYFSLIANGIEAKASQNGFTLLLSHSSNSIEKEEQQISKFFNMGVSGLIIVSMKHNYVASDKIRELHNSGFPYVVVSYMSDRDIYQVGTDHELGAFIAVEHLINTEYRNIGYISSEEGNILGEVRKLGYLRALNRSKIQYNSRYIYHIEKGQKDDLDYYEGGYRIANVFLTRKDRPRAFFIYNDLIALGFEQRLLEKGLKIPEDVAIVGFDDIERDLYAPVPLTTVHQPTAEIGKKAFEILAKRIAGHDTVVRTILSPKLVVRKSCGGSSKERAFRDKSIIENKIVT